MSNYKLCLFPSLSTTFDSEEKYLLLQTKRQTVRKDTTSPLRKQISMNNHTALLI